MRSVMSLVLPVLLLAGTSAHASTIQVASAAALGSNDFFDWGQVRVLDANGDAVAQPSPRTIASNLGRTGSVSNGGSFTGLLEGAGTDWLGNFMIGDKVLYSGDTADPFSASTSFTMTFGSPIAGLGLHITSNFDGLFKANLEVFNGAMSLGLFNVAGVKDGAEDGSAPFLGVLSDAVNIDRAVFTLTENADAGFGVNRLLTTDTPTGVTAVPEPATLTLVGLGVLGAMVRRRANQVRVMSMKNGPIQ